MNTVKSSVSLLKSIGEDPKKSVFLLFLVSIFFFLGLGNVNLFDWDEINFAESAREMINSGDYLRVQINYSPFWEKPPFFFWLQVASMKMFGINEYAARFPNALFGFVYLLTFYFIGKKHYSGSFGLIWGLIFVSSLLPYIYFKSGIIDPVFNYFIFLSIYFVLRVISNDGSDKNLAKLALLAGLCSGISVITKGPVGFLLMGLTVFVYLLINRFKNFPKLKHILLFLVGLILIISSWLTLEVLQNGFNILKQFIAYQAELFSSDVAGHAQPFYYHFVVVFFGCFPISVLALPQLLRSDKTEPHDLRRWNLVLFWVVIILFSIVTTKIIHYSSMTYIPLAFLAALTLEEYRNGRRDLKKALKYTFLILGLIVGIAVTSVPIIIYNKESLYPLMNDPFAVASLKHAVQWSGYEFLIGLIFIAGVILSFVWLSGKRWSLFVLTTASNMAITLLLVLLFILPKIESFTQRPAIDFYKSIQSEDCYVESFGFKSYAQYYYSDLKHGLREERKDQTWLLTGNIDKPVYMVSKITNTELDNHPNFKRIGQEGGFNFYRRDP